MDSLENARELLTDRRVRLIGKLTDVKRDVLSAHRHDFYEVFWITNGQGTGWIDFDRYAIQPLMLCFISPGQVHAWDMTEPANGHLLSFTSAFFAASAEDQTALLEIPFFYTVGSEPVLRVSHEHAPVFTDVCQKVEREAWASLVDRDATMPAYLRILLIEAKRLHETLPTTAHIEAAGFLLTKCFLRLVELHFLTISSVADYAAMLQVTANHLIEAIKRTMGKPAGKVIRERLLLEAKRLLRYSARRKTLPTGKQDTFSLAQESAYFRQERLTNEHGHLVLMCVEPGADIGEKVHG